MEPKLFVVQPGLKKEKIDDVKNVVDNLNAHSTDKIVFEDRIGNDQLHIMFLGFKDKEQREFFRTQFKHDIH
jgi:hypothetical protein